MKVVVQQYWWLHSGFWFDAAKESIKRWTCNYRQKGFSMLGLFLFMAQSVTHTRTHTSYLVSEDTHTHFHSHSHWHEPLHHKNLSSLPLQPLCFSPEENSSGDLTYVSFLLKYFISKNRPQWHLLTYSKNLEVFL